MYANSFVTITIYAYHIGEEADVAKWDTVRTEIWTQAV